MTNENFDTTNKLIKPEDISSSDDEVIRQLSENLQDITTEDIDAMCDEMDEAKKGKEEEKLKIPQELKDYRQIWKNNIEFIDDDTKESIIKSAEKIKVNVETESDGSRLIEFNLGGKKWKILDPKLDTHTDQSDDYVYHTDYDLLARINVRLRGMRGDNIHDWENKSLANYVKEKQQEGLHIPTKNEMEKLLGELGKQINSDQLSGEIAMLMYLTGMDGRYRLSMVDQSWRSLLNCFEDNRDFYFSNNGYSSANLCMIACE